MALATRHLPLVERTTPVRRSTNDPRAKHRYDGSDLSPVLNLPPELQIMIFESICTPFHPPHAPIGYILDPLVTQSFRDQLDIFQAQLRYLYSLGASEGLQRIEENWRRDWELCMRDMVEKDKAFWRGRSIGFSRGVRGYRGANKYVCVDIYQSAKSFCDTRWEVKSVVMSLGQDGEKRAEVSHCGYRAILDETQFKRITLISLVEALRFDLMFHAMDQNRSPNDKKARDWTREVMHKAAQYRFRFLQMLRINAPMGWNKKLGNLVHKEGFLLGQGVNLDHHLDDDSADGLHHDFHDNLSLQEALLWEV